MNCSCASSFTDTGTIEAKSAMEAIHDSEELIISIDISFNCRNTWQIEFETSELIFMAKGIYKIGGQWTAIFLHPV